uniref:Uncharacterized protein n=1 Tax=Cyprinus carpio TaxID=7962 RepID=A0A8C1ULL0_CYPCA
IIQQRRSNKSGCTNFIFRVKSKLYKPTTYEISVKIGEKLKLDVLMTNADKVYHQNKTSKNDRLTDTDGNLSINDFTTSDAGTYRVLDYEGNILITVTVTGERYSIRGKLKKNTVVKIFNICQAPVLIFSLSFTVLHHILDLTHVLGVQYYLYNMNYVLYYPKEMYFASEH